MATAKSRDRLNHILEPLLDNRRPPAEASPQIRCSARTCLHTEALRPIDGVWACLCQAIGRQVRDATVSKPARLSHELRSSDVATTLSDTRARAHSLENDT